MKTRRYSFVLLLFCIFPLSWAGGSFGAPGATNPETSPLEKVAVVDGHVVHNAGELWSHVTNWGLIGSRFSASYIFSDSPSAMWPGGSGVEYLYEASPWVGGLVLGEQRVTTGGEFLPTEALGDTIYPTAHGAPGGNRFPWPNADDDGDGLEDEEILNGLDDDGDGLIDEDYAAISDQHFVCGYNDTESALLEANPLHNPLQVKILQQSIQWSNPLAEDFIGYDFTITNTGSAPIEQVYVGMFSDFDIGPRGMPVAEDDHAGSWRGPVQAADGRWVNVELGYMYDAAAVSPVNGYAAWVLCGHTTDPTGATAPVEPHLRTFQRFSGQAAFSAGGDPTNDAERYQSLSAGLDEWDADSLNLGPDDYRVLISCGPFPSLAPGESISYQVALVLGDGLDDMIANAAEAVATYQGVDYNRDGDPANGDEFTVHWLQSEDAPVPARTGWIKGRIVPEGVELTIETNTTQQAGLTVMRRSSAGVTERRWSASEWTVAGSSASHPLFRLLDTDPVGWPRAYGLILEDADGSQPLGQVELALPGLADFQLSASPNPFNPMVNIRYSVPRAGLLVLQAFDLRGRLVRTLVDEVRDAGPGSVVWHGDDDSGRALASGVYQLRLATEGRLVEERVTLVR